MCFQTDTDSTRFFIMLTYLFKNSFMTSPQEIISQHSPALPCTPEIS